MTLEEGLTLQRSVDFVLALVRLEVEVHGVNASRIFIGGVGQGGALALAAGVQCEQALGGIFAIASWFPASSLRLPRAPAAVLA